MAVRQSTRAFATLRSWSGEFMRPTGISKLERFFREAASLDIDKEDIKRYDDFISAKVHDLLLRGEANAHANSRDIIQPYDLPITKGLQESIHVFEQLDKNIGLAPLLNELPIRPQPFAVELSDETEERLPNIAGGLSVALAKSFKIINPKLKNPQSEHWQLSFQIFNLLL
jgi:hypothetical protein